MHLRDWMKLNNVTQQELARRMSPPVSQAKVSHWLQGARRIDLHSALQLEAITNGQVTVRELAQLSSSVTDAREEPGQGGREFAQEAS